MLPSPCRATGRLPRSDHRRGKPDAQRRGGPQQSPHKLVPRRCRKENAAAEQSAKGARSRVGEAALSPSLGQECNSGQHLRLRDRSHEQHVSRLRIKPSQNACVRAITHQLRNDRSVQDNHRRIIRIAAAPASPHAAATRASPLKGLKSSYSAVPNPFAGTGFCSTASAKITRASSSIERPLPAARMRRRVFTPSSRLRIVMLAKVAPPTPLSDTTA